MTPRNTRLALAAILTLLAGCGQTGPLYMPDDQAARERYDPGNAYGTAEQGKHHDDKHHESEDKSHDQQAPQSDNGNDQGAVASPLTAPDADMPQPQSSPATGSETASPENGHEAQPQSATEAEQAQPDTSNATPESSSTSTDEKGAQPNAPSAQSAPGYHPQRGAKRWQSIQFTPYGAATQGEGLPVGNGTSNNGMGNR